MFKASTTHHYLRNGINFIKNPDLMPDPSEARREKIQFLTGLNLLDVAKDKAWSTEDIRALSIGLVAQMKEGKRLKKDELLSELKAFQDEERKAKSGLFEAMIEDGVIDVALIDMVYAAVSANMTPKEVSELIEGSLRSRHDTEKSLVQTGWNRLVKSINRDPKFVAYRAAWLKAKSHFEATVTQPFHRKYRAEKAEAMKESQENQITVNRQPILEFTGAVLSSPEQYNYQAVTYAIGFATGRRMGEILGDHSTWKVSGDYEIEFTGLLKTKSQDRINEMVKLITIVPANLVMNGIEYLNRCNVKIDHERVNARYSKELSTRAPKAVKEMRLASGTKMVKNPRTGRIEETTAISQFKDTRDFYAAYHTIFTYDQSAHGALNHFLTKRVMHHEDYLTSQIYQKMNII